VFLKNDDSVMICLFSFINGKAHNCGIKNLLIFLIIKYVFSQIFFIIVSILKFHFSIFLIATLVRMSTNLT